MKKSTAVFEQEGEWWIYVEELPGDNAQGQTLGEARENLKEAVQLVMPTGSWRVAKPKTRASSEKS